MQIQHMRAQDQTKIHQLFPKIDLIYSGKNQNCELHLIKRVKVCDK